MSHKGPKNSTEAFQNYCRQNGEQTKKGSIKGRSGISPRYHYISSTRLSEITYIRSSCCRDSLSFGPDLEIKSLIAGRSLGHLTTLVVHNEVFYLPDFPLILPTPLFSPHHGQYQKGRRGASPILHQCEQLAHRKCASCSSERACFFIKILYATPPTPGAARPSCTSFLESLYHW